MCHKRWGHVLHLILTFEGQHTFSGCDTRSPPISSLPEDTLSVWYSWRTIWKDSRIQHTQGCDELLHYLSLNTWTLCSTNGFNERGCPESHEHGCSACGNSLGNTRIHGLLPLERLAVTNNNTFSECTQTGSIHGSSLRDQPWPTSTSNKHSNECWHSTLHTLSQSYATRLHPVARLHKTWPIRREAHKVKKPW